MLGGLLNLMVGGVVGVVGVVELIVVAVVVVKSLINR